MNVLVGCEVSGVIRDAFRDLGHAAWSCDLLGPDQRPDEFRRQRWPNYHLEGDVRWFLDEAPGGGRWDLFIAHPDCTYVTNSGSHWISRERKKSGTDARLGKALEAKAFFEELLWAAIPKICLENPLGLLSTWVRQPDQIVQPYQSGDDASKATGLWLVGLQALVLPPRASWAKPRWVDGDPCSLPRWANQTDSGQNRESPHPDRWLRRAVTYPGIATAMAAQWGGAVVAPAVL